MSNKIKQTTVIGIDNYVVLSMLRKMGMNISIKDLHQMSSFKIKEEIEKSLRISEPGRFYGLEHLCISLDKRAFNNPNISYCIVEFFYKEMKLDYFEDFLTKLRTPISVVFTGLSPRVVNPVLAIKGDVSLCDFMAIIGSVDEIKKYRNTGPKSIPQIKQRLAEWGYTK